VQPQSYDPAFPGAKLRLELWPHQQRAVAAVDNALATDGTSTYLVVPPGGGKTLIGLEAARRLGRRTLVLCPNTGLFLPLPPGRRAAVALAVRRLTGRGIPATVVYHPVPTALATNRKLAETFARAWNARVSPGQLLYAGSPEGTGILAAQRGDDPFAVTTQIRTLWR